MLTGCALISRHRAEAEAKLCWDKVKIQPQLNIISSKLAFGHDDPTFSMLANTSKPTEEEKSAINVYANLRTNCLKEDDKALVDYPLAVQQLFISSRGATENQLVALYKCIFWPNLNTHSDPT
jgi:hypothetical protein